MSRSKIFSDETKIIDTAYDQITETGIEDFSLRGLAKALDVNPMTLYHYVDDKSDILKKVILKGLDIFKENLREEVSRLNGEPGDPASVYRILSRLILDCAKRNPNMYRFMFDTEIPELVGEAELVKAYGGAAELFWENVPKHDRETLHNEILLFETLMNALILKQMGRPDYFDEEKYFTLIDLSLERLFH